MTDFLILRHAPTAWNQRRLIQGRRDIALSPEGLRLARNWRMPAEAAQWTCLSSPLLRARQTAAAMGLAPLPDAGLVEMDWGTLEGRSLADVRSEGGADFAALEALGLDFRPPCGETPREVGTRALSALLAIGTDAAVVTHKGVLRALLALATGWDMRSKSSVPLKDHCCHRFATTSTGRLELLEPNIALGGDDGLT